MPVRDKGQEIFCRTLDAPFVGSFKARLGFFLGGYAFVFVGHGASLMVMTKIQTPQQVQAILAEVRSQTDRGAAIVAAAVLDDILRTLILGACPSRFDVGVSDDWRGAHAALASLTRLWAVQMSAHSALTFSMPRNRNCLNPLACLICPNTGSTICFRNR